MMFRRTLWLVLALALAGAAPCEAESPEDAAIMVRLTFDGAHQDPERGVRAPAAIPDETSRQPGRTGMALRLGGGGPAAFRYLLDESPWARPEGAVSMWVKPVSWFDVADVEERGLMVFCRLPLRRGALLIERQGLRKSPPVRQDLLIAGVFGVPEITNALVLPTNTSRWKNGDWHFVAVNWSRTGLACSLDGAEFQKTAFTRALQPDDGSGISPSLELGGGNADPEETTLVDDVVLYRRPLSIEEVRRLCDYDQ